MKPEKAGRFTRFCDLYMTESLAILMVETYDSLREIMGFKD